MRRFERFKSVNHFVNQLIVDSEFRKDFYQHYFPLNSFKMIHYIGTTMSLNKALLANNTFHSCMCNSPTSFKHFKWLKAQTFLQQNHRRGSVAQPDDVTPPDQNKSLVR